MGGNPDEVPPHEVELTQGFFIGKYEVTWGQYRVPAVGKSLDRNLLACFRAKSHRRSIFIRRKSQTEVGPLLPSWIHLDLSLWRITA